MEPSPLYPASRWSGCHQPPTPRHSSQTPLVVAGQDKSVEVVGRSIVARGDQDFSTLHVFHLGQGWLWAISAFLVRPLARRPMFTGPHPRAGGNSAPRIQKSSTIAEALDSDTWCRDIHGALTITILSLGKVITSYGNGHILDNTPAPQLTVLYSLARWTWSMPRNSGMCVCPIAVVSLSGWCSIVIAGSRISYNGTGFRTTALARFVPTLWKPWITSWFNVFNMETLFDPSCSGLAVDDSGGEQCYGGLVAMLPQAGGQSPSEGIRLTGFPGSLVLMVGA
jgi:hypothetical protein